MSIDYGERERQFLATLEADSGKPLEAWMAAIRAQGLTHRNDIIDWLRRQGFMFSKASWLERIYNNGGKPIYDGAPSGRRPQTRPRQTPAPTTPAPATPAIPPTPAAPIAAAASPPAAERPRLTLVVQNPPPAAPVTETARPAQTAQAPVAAPVVPPPAPPASPKPQPVVAAPTSAEGSSDPAAIDALLARAKAFRPLAVYVTAEIRKRVPDVTVTARDGYLAFINTNGAFALLAVSAKELKLGLALKSPPADSALEAGKLAGLRGAPPVSHVATLTDARQVTPALMAAIAEAAFGA